MTKRGMRSGRPEVSARVVTRWVVDQLAGIIAAEEGEVLVYRTDLSPGDFVPGIVGRKVYFTLSRSRPGPGPSGGASVRETEELADPGSHLQLARGWERDGLLQSPVMVYIHLYLMVSIPFIFA